MTTKAQARKNLKKAAKAHKEKVRQPVTIEFQNEHIPTILKWILAVLPGTNICTRPVPQNM